MLSPESMDGLIAVACGDAYMKAHSGAQRAGRTRSLTSLVWRGFIEKLPQGEGFILTEAGRRQLPSTVGLKP